ncbi:sensor histidine kinase, partial [Pseudomonas aeruginosa]
LEFADLERQGNQTPDLVLASDAKGNVFLANHSCLRYRELEQLDTVDRFELVATRDYDRQHLTLLRHQTERSYGADRRLARGESADGEKDYFWHAFDMPNAGWTLHLLRDTASLQDDVATARPHDAGPWMSPVFRDLYIHTPLR